MDAKAIETTALNAKARSAGRVLVAEDDEALLHAYGRVLRAAGFSVEEVVNAEEAVARIAKGSFDVVVSDIDMPRMSGIDLLRSIRTSDLDMPFVLITGKPTVETATDAIDSGVLRYLVKPVDGPTLIETITRAVRLNELFKLTHKGSAMPFIADPGGLEATFSRALAGIHMAYQPIVRWSDRSCFAVEALARTTEPALARPDRFFLAAERIGKVQELGRAVRASVASSAPKIPPETRIFINLHPIELLDPALFDPREPLSQYATRVTLEITERAALHGMNNLRARIMVLRALGYQIAIDDMGAGYASLSSFAQIGPDVAKVDMSLVRGIHLEPTKQSLVSALCRMCADLGISVVLEGVETREELDALRALGCELFQGYLFSRPGPLPIQVDWSSTKS
jgi:EAL domain-containing protein (putative c-di-GMP-specific phosphodiesterase class I)